MNYQSVPTTEIVNPAPHKNTSTRDYLNTTNPNAIGIVYRAPVSESWKTFLCCYGLLNPFSCVLCNLDTVYQSTYVQVHENRIETNYPGLNPCDCCCTFNDNVSVFYYDNTMMQNVDTVGCCSPCCTHNTCFPDCCGICGESAIIHSNGCCGCICKRWKMIPGLKNAREFVDATRHAKSTPRTITMIP